MESFETPKLSEVISCKFSGTGDVKGMQVHWHELVLANGDKGRCGVQENNLELIKTGSTINYQYIPLSRDSQGNPTSYKIKYLTPSSADYKLRNMGIKVEQGQLPLSTPTPTNQNTPALNFDKSSNKELNQSLESVWGKKAKTGGSKGSYNANSGQCSPDGRKYSYAKHPDDYLGYAFSYAKDLVVEMQKTALNEEKRAKNSQSHLKESAENINKVARYLYSNMVQMLMQSELTDEIMNYPEELHEDNLQKDVPKKTQRGRPKNSPAKTTKKGQKTT